MISMKRLLLHHCVLSYATRCYAALFEVVPYRVDILNCIVVRHQIERGGGERKRERERESRTGRWVSHSGSVVKPAGR